MYRTGTPPFIKRHAVGVVSYETGYGGGCTIGLSWSGSSKRIPALLTLIRYSHRYRGCSFVNPSPVPLVPRMGCVLYRAPRSVNSLRYLALRRGVWFLARDLP